MATTVDPSFVTDAVVALLTAELETADPPGILIGDGLAPAAAAGDSALDLTQPYVVVNQIPSGAFGGGYTGAGGEVTLRYQFSAVGIQRNQAERAASLAQRTLTDRVDGGPSSPFVNALAPTGHTVTARWPRGFIPGEPAGGRHRVISFVDLMVQVQ